MRALLVLLLAAASGPALAQHSGHAAPPPAGPDPHAAHRTPPADSEESDPHAGHEMDEPDDPHAGHRMAEPDDPHAGHEMAEPDDPHTGHEMETPAATNDPHAGHGMETPPAPPVGPPPPGAFAGPEHAADELFGAEPMAAAREELRATHGDLHHYLFLVDRLEARLRGGADGYAWDAAFRYGGDIDRLWLKSEGEGAFGEGLERGEVQALWSHAIGPFFDFQAGARLDFGPGPERPHLVAGVQGLAPYWFEVDAALFLSSEGDITARLEAEYDQRITQRLILQPRVEAELSLQDVPELGIGAGLSSAEAGLRLRYEIVPEFAPYVGIEYERAFGDTARFIRAAGEDPGGWSLLLGVRAWF